MDTSCSAAEILQQIEVRTTRFFESDNLSIQDGILGKLKQTFNDVWGIGC